MILIYFLLLLLSTSASLGVLQAQSSLASWAGVLLDPAGKPLSGATVELRKVQEEDVFNAVTNKAGIFSFQRLPSGSYTVSVRWGEQERLIGPRLEIEAGRHLEFWLEVSRGRNQIVLHEASATTKPGGEAIKETVTAQGSGGERLSSQEVSSLPLNKRDFSQLLLLAAGTMTDANGAANFTSQFAVNGQRGNTAVFAIDGIDATDPELGGATFSNFNVDAIQEIRSSSGVMPAEIGQGAAGFTNVITKSGTAKAHGTFFEFHRNAALDARNFFDRRTIANPGRIPPFIRNEFGFTNGGPVIFPGLYNGKERTFYFGQYQGFRQVRGITQILPVPSVEERQGINATAYPGDILRVPVSPLIASVLARYPLPNDLQGPYGTRTYATSAKVRTLTSQFSLRLDHRLSSQSQLFARFNLNNVTGPETNPSQIAIDPDFAIRFLDRQRSFGLTLIRNFSPRLLSETSVGFLRTTPLFPTIDRVQPALLPADGLYEGFNTAGGQALGALGNLFQLRQSFAYAKGSHNLKMGTEARLNRDTTIFAFYPNGQYIFGGGRTYSPVEIRSQSGLHDVHAGDPLPDTLTSFLTATPFSYTTSVAPSIFSQGDHLGLSAIHRESYDFYFQDNWKVSPNLSLSYGLRYEFNSRVKEAKKLTSAPVFPNPGVVPKGPFGLKQFLINPRPPYVMDWRGLGPRFALDWQITPKTILHAGGAINTGLPNLFQTNYLTGGFPFVFNPYLTAAPLFPIAFRNEVTRLTLPPLYTLSGSPVFASGRSTDVSPNTEVDLVRFQQDLAHVTPSGQISPLGLFAMSQDFRNGYIINSNAGLEQDFGDLKVSVSYVATSGIKLASTFFPNGYAGADAAFAPFTHFAANGHLLAGLGPLYLMTSRGHSTYHSLQASVQKTSTRAGIGFQASYTFSKSLDDVSSALVGLGSTSGSGGAQLQGTPQDPFKWRAEKGPSTFDISQVLVFNVVQALPVERLNFLRFLGRGFTSGWKFMNITTLTSGSPFSVFSGVQQTGAGSNNGDRPDQVGQPVLSTTRRIREDYFGQGVNNAAFFYIPIGIQGGTGPSQGRAGSLGRNTFRGPGFHNFDCALIKDTLIERRSGADLLTLQFRVEVFNTFNLVNFSLPANILRGSGFGLINQTAGPSRQIQFSLKLIY